MWDNQTEEKMGYFIQRLNILKALKEEIQKDNLPYVNREIHVCI